MAKMGRRSPALTAGAEEATRRLAILEARTRRLPPSPLRTIELTLIGDARRGLSGETTMPARDVRRLADQVLSGRFGAGVGGS